MEDNIIVRIKIKTNHLGRFDNPSGGTRLSSKGIGKLLDYKKRSERVL